MASLFQGPVLPGQSTNAFRQTGNGAVKKDTNLGNLGLNTPLPGRNTNKATPNKATTVSSPSNLVSGGSIPLQKSPNSPDLNQVNSSFAPAMSALNEYQNSLQSQLNGSSPLAGESQLRSSAADTQALYQSGLADKQQQYGQERTQAQSDTDAAVAEARRQGNEMIQGIQSKFGGTTGTGAFVGELTGRGVLQNIAQNRAAFEQTVTHINDALSSAEKEVGRQIESLNNQLTSAVQGLRDNLMSQIQQINLQKGQLESQKAAKKLDLMQQFSADKAQVEAQNTAFQQQLYSQLQQHQQAAAQLKGQTAEQFTTTLQALNKQGFQVTGGTVGNTGLYNNIQFAPTGNTGTSQDFINQRTGGTDNNTPSLQTVNWDDPSVDPFATPSNAGNIGYSPFSGGGLS